MDALSLYINMNYHDIYIMNQKMHFKGDFTKISHFQNKVCVSIKEMKFLNKYNDIFLVSCNFYVRNETQITTEYLLVIFALDMYDNKFMRSDWTLTAYSSTHHKSCFRKA